MDLKQLGRYEILSAIGKGAMGIVYRAEDPMLQRTVAVKTVNLFLDQDELADYEARFYQEAKAAGRLNHPNIVTIYDVGKEGHVAYMAMEFLEGRELKSLLAARKPLPLATALDIAAQVADGLAYAHANDIVHRDIKPANIMILNSGLVKIMDFGIARMRTSEVRTQTGVLLGSPPYMSPEQVLGRRADHRSDIFSLGIVLYEMLTGERPFTGSEMSAIMYHVVHLSPRAPSQLNSAVPDILDFIVAKALAKAPDARYQDTKDLANDLRECRKYVESNVQPNVSINPQSFPEHLMTQLADGGRDAMAGDGSIPTTRKMDAADAPPDGQETPVALGISKAFDSYEATMRLAVATGSQGQVNEIGAELKPARPAATPKSPASGPRKAGAPAPRPPRAPRKPPARGWNWEALIFGAGVAVALVVAALIVLR
ncbi:MAG: serine/threonine-protein kinase [Pseudomonadota bacterium]